MWGGGGRWGRQGQLLRDLLIGLSRLFALKVHTALGGVARRLQGCSPRAQPGTREPDETGRPAPPLREDVKAGLKGDDWGNASAGNVALEESPAEPLDRQKDGEAGPRESRAERTLEATAAKRACPPPSGQGEAGSQADATMLGTQGQREERPGLSWTHSTQAAPGGVCRAEQGCGAGHRDLTHPRGPQGSEPPSGTSHTDPQGQLTGW